MTIVEAIIGQIRKYLTKEKVRPFATNLHGGIDA